MQQVLAELSFEPRLVDNVSERVHSSPVLVVECLELIVTWKLESGRREKRGCSPRQDARQRFERWKLFDQKKSGRSQALG